MSDSSSSNISSSVYAYEPDHTLRTIIGASTALSEIFTPEKINACQKLVDEARLSFFDTARPDMDTIRSLSHAPIQDYDSLCQQLFTPACAIKSQAETFGFPLIARVCGYLTDYCEQRPSVKRMTPRDALIVGKLVNVLEKAFNQRITDTGGAIERELVALIEQWRA